jgi:2-polyprenyl-3-methyl-5-hydroxy-6-metoxy-1,4-benzoquinol methylase
MNSKEINSCICSETNNTVLFTAESYSVCRCISCGQVYVKGIDLNVIKDKYDEKDYFAERNDYINRWDEFSRLFQKIIDKIIKFKPQGRLLDVGCSVGIFLDVARKNGFDVKGVEVSTWASEFARQKGFDVITGGILEAAYPEQSFDVVVLNHVLEHVPKPAEILLEAKRILKEDGLLVIGVPNFGSSMAAIKKEKWASLQPDQHIWQFTHESLLRALMKSGFSEVYFEARDNHRIHWFRWDSILFFMINTCALLRNNAEAMLLFVRKIK